jgi:hypothetical protein
MMQFSLRFFCFIVNFSQNKQGDSGRGVSILKGDSIGHCEGKKSLYNMCLILNGYRDRAKESTNTKPLLIVIKKEKLLVSLFHLRLKFIVY